MLPFSLQRGLGTGPKGRRELGLGSYYSSSGISKFDLALATRPVSEDNTIIFPYDYALRGYSIIEYNPKMTKGAVSNSEIIQAFDLVEN